MLIQEIKTRIFEAEIKSELDTDDVQLVAVPKVQHKARVQAVLETGYNALGENRVQDPLGKKQDFQQTFWKFDLHLIDSFQAATLDFSSCILIFFA